MAPEQTVHRVKSGKCCGRSCGERTNTNELKTLLHCHCYFGLNPAKFEYVNISKRFVFFFFVIILSPILMAFVVWIAVWNVLFGYLLYGRSWLCNEMPSKYFDFKWSFVSNINRRYFRSSWRLMQISFLFSSTRSFSLYQFYPRNLIHIRIQWTEFKIPCEFMNKFSHFKHTITSNLVHVIDKPRPTNYTYVPIKQ